jgi:hypothetical protein
MSYQMRCKNCGRALYSSYVPEQEWIESCERCGGVVQAPQQTVTCPTSYRTVKLIGGVPLCSDLALNFSFSEKCFYHDEPCNCPLLKA